MVNREKVIERIGEYFAADIINKLGEYINEENKRLLKVGYTNQVRKMFIEFPELAIVDRTAKIGYGDSEIRATNTGWNLCKTYIEGNGWVKEVK